MIAEIEKKTDKGFGVTVYDNNDVRHKIGVLHNGEINGHLQDGYPDDPVDRTMEGNEHVRQARRYAKWHVYRKRGYETLDRHENPDCLVAAMIAVSTLSEDATREQFDDLRTQVQSHYSDSPVELPFEDADPDDPLVYRKDLYISPDPLAVEPPLAEQYAEVVTEIQQESSAVLTESSDIEHQLQELFGYQDRLETELPAFELEAISGMHYLYTDGETEQTQSAESPLDRQFDARIELPPVNLDEFELFRLLLMTNLSAQVRDRYLMMGEQPPQAFQHHGFGSYRGTVKQQINEMYEKWYLFSESDIGW